MDALPPPLTTALSGRYAFEAAIGTGAVDRGLVNYPFLSNFDRFLVPLRQRKDFADLLERVHREWTRFATL
jgi:hypothetical protein